MNTYLKRVIRKKSPWEHIVKDLKLEEYLGNGNKNNFVRKIGIFSGIAAAGTALIASYPLLLRPWYLHWGANAEEIKRYIAGDEKIENPDYVATRALTIHAKPEQIWPWIIETGFEQNGLNSYEWLDKMFGFKSEMHIEASGKTYGKLNGENKKAIRLSKDLPVQKLEQYQNIVLGRQQDGFGWTWTVALYPLNNTSTRLVTRTRVRLTKDIKTKVMNLFMDPASFFMIRKWLYAVKNLSEVNAEEEYEETEKTPIVDETE